MKSALSRGWRDFAGLRAYLRDKMPLFFLFLLAESILILFLWAFKTSPLVILLVTILNLLPLIFWLVFDYWRRRSYYRALLINLDQLEQAYLVLETLDPPHFYDGQILQEALYRVNRSMNDNVKHYEAETKAFREYIELWIHEVKTPLAALNLMERDPRALEQLKRLDDFVEQVLFFARAENAEQDYRITATNLADLAHQVALRNQPIFLAKHVDFATHDLDLTVWTDAKWLEFILGQIVSNSVKYGGSRIEISAQHGHHQTILRVVDNGFGIDAKDLPRVFEKSFTGQNGHLQRTDVPSSTGMGLYIVKTLCDKLGHKIAITSQPGQGTTVSLTFADHEFYHEVTKK